jgi:hypothetical protein
MSRYHTLYDSTGVAKFQTVLTGAASVRSAAITSRRVTITTAAVPHFVAFGTSTVVATTASCIVPANTMMDFNFVNGQYVAALSSSGASYITIIDSD